MADGEHKHTVYANKAELPYKHLDNLGRGSYALVDKVETIGSDPQIYARKTIRTRYFRAAAQQKQITSEIKIARRLRHDHIVRLIGTYQAGLDFGIIMSPVADMDLGEYLARADVDSGFYTQMDARCRLHKWIFCLTSAVDYLHGEKIRHKDLKPANILIKGDQIFITDFGISKDLINDATTGSIGFPSERTPMYCAPEANIEDARRGRAADMFSLGCVFLEMWTVASGKSLAEFEEYRIADGHVLSQTPLYPKLSLMARGSNLGETRKNTEKGSSNGADVSGDVNWSHSSIEEPQPNS
ncbi:kinase-like protein [Lophium mytilinum]|uniref:Kinase-like protein n=1 Tax=Lophium mytilinum TaxID=390894 RepID=A0A6A6R8M8_9PEZI|nr:kinase-like protein [Lophium mytilinum]